ncbi:hypothetical protein TWF696_008941 [Orbilia brochopaga]|uniref:Uncharacterized protein n=1 Tax=Orbilia brochopaga TaxID=3140254 RepID=A0AAV9UHS5_9PEZI
MFKNNWNRGYRRTQDTRPPLDAPYSRLGNTATPRQKHAIICFAGNVIRQQRALLGILLLVIILICFYMINVGLHLSKFTALRFSDFEDRPLIIYTYHETENSRENVIFFLKHGLHDGADFIFVINGGWTQPLDIPVGEHITVIHRKNTCFDIGANGEVLSRNGLARKYRKFILMNSSIRGPFMPTWSDQCWSDAYLSKLSDTNKLVGMTMNCNPWDEVIQPHLQSMILATDQIGISILLDSVITKCFRRHSQAVRAEMNITASIISAGYTISALMTAFSSDKDGYTQHCNK